MKRFLIVTSILAILFVALGVDVVPVRCHYCEHTIHHTDCAAAFYGAHKNVCHEQCLKDYLTPDPAPWPTEFAEADVQRPLDEEPPGVEEAS